MEVSSSSKMANQVREISAVKDQQMKEAAEKSARSVFVGNIPYEASDEQLKDIFSQAGPVLSFRLVYDRETGKPKGYGFCEYKDTETAQSAMRNLNGTEIHGRQLRVDSAASQKGSEDPRAYIKEISPYGEEVTPEKAPETITNAVASLPPEQMFELMKQMKLCIQNNPDEARQMLLQNPQLAYALLQAQVIMKIVDPKVADAILHQPRGEPLPINKLMDQAGISGKGQQGPPAGGAPGPPGPPPHKGDNWRGGSPARDGFRGDMRGPPGPPERMGEFNRPHGGDHEMRGPPQDRDFRGPPGNGPGNGPGGPPDDRFRNNGPPPPFDPARERGGAPMERPPDDPRGGPPPPEMRGPPQQMMDHRDPRMREENRGPPRDDRGGPPIRDDRRGPPQQPRDPHGFPNDGRGGPPPPEMRDFPGGPPLHNREPEFRPPTSQFGGPPHNGPPGPGHLPPVPPGHGGPPGPHGPPGGPPGGPPPMNGPPHGGPPGLPPGPPLPGLGGPLPGPPISGPPGGPPGPPGHQPQPPPHSQQFEARRDVPTIPAGLGGLSGGASAAAGGPNEEEKQRLIMQVLNLTDNQINMLPEDQRESIRLLKAQFATGGPARN